MIFSLNDHSCSNICRSWHYLTILLQLLHMAWGKCFKLSDVRKRLWWLKSLKCGGLRKTPQWASSRSGLLQSWGGQRRCYRSCFNPVVAMTMGKRQGRVWWTDCRILLLSRSHDTVSTLTSISLGSSVRSFWIKIIFERLVSSYKTFPWISTWRKKGKVWEPHGTVTPLPYVLPFIFLRL